MSGLLKNVDFSQYDNFDFLNNTNETSYFANYLENLYFPNGKQPTGQISKVVASMRSSNGSGGGSGESSGENGGLKAESIADYLLLGRGTKWQLMET